MKCTVCGYELPANGLSAVQCPHCGTVNVARAELQPNKLGTFTVAVTHQGTHGLRARLLGHRKPAIVAGAVMAILVIAASALAAGMHHHSPQYGGSIDGIHVAAIRPPDSTAPSPTPTPTPTQAPKPNASTATPTATQAPVVPATVDAVVADINQRLSRYGVKASLSPPNNSDSYSTWTTLDSGDMSHLQQFDTYLTEEFRKYPTDLVVNSGVKTIGLVKDLHVSGQTRAAVPVPNLTEMVYDVDLMVNSGSEYAREVVSHEYWHYLDYKTHGDYYYADPTWSACNPSGFTYGAGGSSAYDPNSGYVAAFHPSADFITAYSKYGIEEDRAEMFGWLIYDPGRVKGLNDPGINCKINRLTTLVHQLSPGMNF